MSSVIRRIAVAVSAMILASFAAAAPAVAHGSAAGTLDLAPTRVHAVGGTPAPSPSPSASGAGLATFGISPASATAPDGRSYVIIGAAPGSVVTDNIAVVNQSNFALPLSVYPSDATNAADGTLTLANRGAATDAGTWLTLGTDAVDVPAQSSKGIGYVVVPITVKIPTDAEPGDHVAAVIASLTTTGKGGTNAPNVNFEQRVGARIYITVGGAAKPGLAVVGVRTTYEPGPWWGLLGQGTMRVTYTLKNTGNVRVATKARVSTSGIGGLLPRSGAGTQVDELLPRASVSQTVVVDHVWPLVWTKASVVAAAATAPGATDTKLGPVSVVHGVWTVPWLWLAALLLLVLVLLRRRLTALWRRLPKPKRPRRRGRHAGKGESGHDGVGGDGHGRAQRPRRSAATADVGA